MAFRKGSGRLFILLWACCGAAQAETAPEFRNACEGERGKHILWENDVFTGKLFGKSDKWYTNGVKLYTSDLRDCVSDNLPGFLHDPIEGLRDVHPDGDATYTLQVGNVYGQLMFTPRILTTAAPQPMDRFWGGWLYAGIVVQRQPYDKRQETWQFNTDELETLELDLGVTGPASLAEQVQRGIHVISNSTMPQGWNNQIRTEPGIQFNYARVMRVWKYPGGNGVQPHVDFSWHYGGAAGTLFDYVNGGATLRFGGRLTDMAPNVIESPSIGQFKAPDNAMYFLARLDMKGVAHNTFIDGSLLRGAPHTSYVSSKWIVPQLTFGGVMEWQYNDDGQQEGKRLSVLIHRRGSEFRSPAGPAPMFSFATINFEWDLGQ